jgi:hypothetical protein
VVALGCSSGTTASPDAAVDAAEGGLTDGGAVADAAPDGASVPDGSADAGLDAGPYVPWARAYGSLPSTPTAFLGATTSTPTGDWVVTGEHGPGMLSFGGPTITPGSVFLAKIDKNGNTAFQKSYPRTTGGQYDYARPLAAVSNAQGEIFVAGEVRGGLDLEGTVVGGLRGGWLLKVDAAGTKKFAKGFSAPAVTAKAMAIDPSGNIYVGFEWSVSCDFGGGVRTGSNDQNFAIAKYDGNGTWLWDAEFASAGANGTLVTVGLSGGRVSFGGRYCNANMVLGGTTLPDAGDYGNAYLGTLDAATGAYVSHRVFASGGEDAVTLAAGDGAGGLFVAGHYEQTIDFGQGNLTSMGGLDLFVLRQNAQGSTLWAKRFGDSQQQLGPRGLVDSKGNLHLFGQGWISGQIDFGGGPRPTQMFAATLDGNGGHLASEGWATSNPSNPIGIACDPADHIAYFGGLGDTLGFNGTALSPVGGSMYRSFFLATYAK